MNRKLLVISGTIVLLSIAGHRLYQEANTPVLVNAQPALPPDTSVRNPKPVPMQTTKPKGAKLAHDFTLKDLKGQQVSLSDYRDRKVVILDFWATWCGPCRMTMPALQSFGKKYANKVEVLSINQMEDPERVASYIRSQSYTSLHVLLDRDGGVSKAYRVYGIPTLHIINLDGELCYTHVGFRQNLGAHLEEKLAQHCNIEL